MVIDIISYEDEQFAQLTEEQLLEVRSVQQKVNELRLKKVEIAEEAKFRLLKRGVVRSSMMEYGVAEELAAIDGEIDNLREGLLFYLRFSTPSVPSTDETGYLVDTSLSYEERYHIVFEYYQTTYTDAAERFKAFKADTVARSYLGELYKVMYDEFYVSS